MVGFLTARLLVWINGSYSSVMNRQITFLCILVACSSAASVPLLTSPTTDQSRDSSRLSKETGDATGFVALTGATEKTSIGTSSSQSAAFEGISSVSTEKPTRPRRPVIVETEPVKHGVTFHDWFSRKLRVISFCRRRWESTCTASWMDT